MIIFSGGGGAGNRGDHRGDRDRGGDRERSIMDRLGPQPASSGFGNTYGLSTQFLESLGIDGPLHTRVFVANVSLFINRSMDSESIVSYVTSVLKTSCSHCIKLVFGNNKSSTY